MMSFRINRLLAVTLMLPGLIAAQVWAADVEKGGKAFKKCVACHDAVNSVNKTGPHLVGLIGRPVANVEGYKYSDAMRALVTTVPVWSEAALDAYLTNPKAVVTKTKMPFGGIKKPDERLDLIAYLKSLKPQ